MAQLYMQRFEYRPCDKAAFDEAWGIANAAMEKSGNWGNVKTGVTHRYGFMTSWGGYALIEVESPAALREYMAFHTNNYAHMADIRSTP
jgi:hypothetical protein